MARSGQAHTARELAERLAAGYVFGAELVELGLGDAGSASATRARSTRPACMGRRSSRPTRSSARRWCVCRRRRLVRRHARRAPRRQPDRAAGNAAHRRPPRDARLRPSREPQRPTEPRGADGGAPRSDRRLRRRPAGAARRRLHASTARRGWARGTGERERLPEERLLDPVPHEPLFGSPPRRATTGSPATRSACRPSAPAPTVRRSRPSAGSTGSSPAASRRARQRPFRRSMVQASRSPTTRC